MVVCIDFSGFFFFFFFFKCYCLRTSCLARRIKGRRKRRTKESGNTMLDGMTMRYDHYYGSTMVKPYNEILVVVSILLCFYIMGCLL
jgi:hypothetical protein